MPFCKKCGKELGGDVKFCSNCGNIVNDNNEFCVIAYLQWLIGMLMVGGLSLLGNIIGIPLGRSGF